MLREGAQFLRDPAPFVYDGPSVPWFDEPQLAEELEEAAENYESWLTAGMLFAGGARVGRRGRPTEAATLLVYHAELALKGWESKARRDFFANELCIALLGSVPDVGMAGRMKKHRAGERKRKRRRLRKRPEGAP